MCVGVVLCSSTCSMILVEPFSQTLLNLLPIFTHDLLYFLCTFGTYCCISYQNGGHVVFISSLKYKPVSTCFTEANVKMEHIGLGVHGV